MGPDVEDLSWNRNYNEVEEIKEAKMERKIAEEPEWIGDKGNIGKARTLNDLKTLPVSSSDLQATVAHLVEQHNVMKEYVDKLLNDKYTRLI